MSRNKTDWPKEFQSFMSAGPVEPPKVKSEAILEKVRADLNPRFWQVFSKLAAIHFVTGSIMLLICPQFDIHLLGGMGLMGVFMRFGELACSVACGAVFLSGSALAASLFLRPEEIKAIRKTELLQLAGLSMLSLGVFVCLGASIVATLGLAWAVGSIAGGLASFELGWLVRSRFRKRLVYGL